MATASSPSLSRSIFLAQFPPSRHTSLHKRCFAKSLSIDRRRLGHSLLRLPFQPFGRRSSCVSAHFGRSSPRRNTLREKLVIDTQVRIPSKQNEGLDSDLTGQSHSSYQNETFGSTVDDSFMGETGIDWVNESGNGVHAGKESDSWGDNSDLGREIDDYIGRYKGETELRGLGSRPIFTTFGDGDGDGSVRRVIVNEDMARRSEVGLPYSKVLEHGEGNSGLPVNSSIAKLVIQGKKLFSVGGLGSIQLRLDTFCRAGVVILCISFVFWVIKKIIVGGRDAQKLTREEKEMLRRKVRLRMEKEKEDCKVEIIGVDSEFSVRPTIRPQLNKTELMDSISRAKVTKESMAASAVFSKVPSSDIEFESKILEIQDMARKAREVERKAILKPESDQEEDASLSQFMVSNGKTHDYFLEMEAQSEFKGDSTLDSMENNVSGPDISSIKDVVSSQYSQGDLKMDVMEENNSRILIKEDHEHMNKCNDVLSPLEMDNRPIYVSNFRDETQLYESNDSNPSLFNEASSVNKPRIITSLNEAREYLSQRCKNVASKEDLNNHGVISEEDSRRISHPNNQLLSKSHNMSDHAAAGGSLIYGEGSYERTSSSEKSRSPERLQDILVQSNGSEPVSNDLTSNAMRPSEVLSNDVGPVDNVSVSTNQNWIEKNFQDFEPIVRKIGLGFRDNFMVAKDEKPKEDSSLSSDFSNVVVNEDDELEWMKDQTLSSIVFKVRENELAGRDPFHMMSAEDRLTFFNGLEKKVEKENKKLESLHKWVHSSIENLDYGIDGISLYDPPEKIIPRWKGPSVNEDPEFFRNIVKHKRQFPSKSLDISQEDGSLSCQQTASEHAPLDGSYKEDLPNRKSMTIKTVIQSSDGSTRVGRKEGKEHWEHTKKWSQEFLEVYNREDDPEVRAMMNDMGKDLDKWISQKEISEAADLMTRLPKRRRQYIEKKMEKLKKEIELFGHQAVVSKYREYSEEKEEDYLWWLDLPFILCIEIYENEDGNQKSGFYSLEMAQDLELDPKPCHVVAFENPTDAKNFCYIIQAHLEMLGNGTAFVVARPPKNAFHEAKANGHNITVIRKGQFQLNVDQTLEEVESEITEIGSKMYHDQIMREHSVDMGALMKGVIGSGKVTKKHRSKRTIRS